ncbi:MAG: hypothetical protein O2960_08480 [Verrucomicrobia bacterium]|nr:hypothetical protein [Verrucomicrobiota bacterium]
MNRTQGSPVQILESELLKLSPAEMRQIRDWLDDLLEDQLKFTDEFEAEIQQSEQEMVAGRHSRARPPMVPLGGPHLPSPRKKDSPQAAIPCLGVRRKAPARGAIVLCWPG